MKTDYGQHCWLDDWQIISCGTSSNLKDTNTITGYTHANKEKRIKTESLRLRCVRILDDIMKKRPDIDIDYCYLQKMINGADIEMLTDAIITRNKFGGQKRFVSYLYTL